MEDWSGHILTAGNGDGTHPIVMQTKHGIVGCTTTAGLGNVCATATIVVWTTAFADTNYSVFCAPSGAATGQPSPFAIESKSNTTITINYSNLTTAVSSYASIDCMAIHDN